MKIRHLLAASALTLAGVNCAPVAPPSAVEEKQASATPSPAKSNTVLPTDAQFLQKRFDEAIKTVRDRELLTTNGFWTIFHGILGLGPSVTLTNPMTGEKVNALDYIASGGELRGLRFVPTRDGLDVETRPGMFISQGHQDQFIAEMVQWGVSPDKPVKVEGKNYTFADFFRHSKMRASLKDQQELEWAIIIVGQHFGTDAKWTNANGEDLRLEDLIRKELDKPIEDATCGGTHRLFGLTWVYHLHLQRGGKVEGVWKEVADKIDQYKKKARALQNPGGSFSTEFFRDRADGQDMKLRINTTGHTFEWLALALTDEELKEPWVTDAANALATMFLEIRGQPMEGGSLYHAVHGLLIYYSRVYGPEKLGPLAPPVPLPPKAKKA